MLHLVHSSLPCLSRHKKGVSGRPHVTLIPCAGSRWLPVLSLSEMAQGSCGLEHLSIEEGVPRAGFVHQGSAETLMHHSVQEYLWGLLGTRLSGDWEMDKSQQSLQADRVTHREFLYDVTDGWIGCHG